MSFIVIDKQPKYRESIAIICFQLQSLNGWQIKQEQSRNHNWKITRWSNRIFFLQSTFNLLFAPSSKQLLEPSLQSNYNREQTWSSHADVHAEEHASRAAWRPKVRYLELLWNLGKNSSCYCRNCSAERYLT